ncbi:Zn(2)-Cys(6) binuclear cluster domain-containing protein [Roridomyces roridus]|uniref:Zn(2)-Cys(6) binuclear cluster domain-containing protein n=1 Tax=Roridomyces roridus TaxID=1738132 RepID=A0AAD7FUE0_9AGAR|nr:Zn(2)-Cys(6) binuclear cluster domain-containing protein [Roridomyces roridus]
MAQESPSSHSFDVPPAKAKACVNCRRRKIKCDGERPKCGQCSRSSGFQDCEYADDGPTRTQVLEEQIAILEARIEEMEKPKALRSTFTLQNPYMGERRSTSLPALSRGGSPNPPMLHSDFTSTPSSPALYEGVPLIELETLIHNFLHHGSQFGFFLNVQNFKEAAFGRSGQRPAAVLLDVVHLWAIHLSGSDELAAYEGRYLSRALRTAVDVLSGTHSLNTVLHCIQAEVLLSHYFLRNTRFLEGKYHISAAVSLVLSSGLHRIRSAETSAASGPLGPAFRSLAPPRDTVEENERINAFWTVLTLNNCWTTADGSPSNISYTVPDARIDTPWPLDINSLHGQSLPDVSVGTVTSFLAHVPDNGNSVAAFHAKAAIVFEQASRLASQYLPNMPHEQLAQLEASFNAIDALIEGFKLALPAVQGGLQSLDAREMFVIHSLAHVATIQLHNPFADEVEASRARALDAARAIVRNLGQVVVNNLVYIDPIMGPLFMATCHVFVAEVMRCRRRRLVGTMDLTSLAQEEQSAKDAFDTILAAMNLFAANCRLMDSQLHTVRQMYHEL